MYSFSYIILFFYISETYTVMMAALQSRNMWSFMITVVKSRVLTDCVFIVTRSV